MSSNNLNVPQVVSSQDQKEVTINAATIQLGQALTAYFPIDLTAGSGYTIASADFQDNLLFQLQNGGIAQTVIVPAVQRALFIVRNESTFDHTLNRGTANLILPAGKQALVQTDGTANGIAFVAIFDNGGQTIPLHLFFGGGLYTATQLLNLTDFDRSVSLPIGLVGSTFAIAVNPTGALVITLKKNGSSIGSVSFSTSGVPTVTFTAAVTFAIGDKLTVFAPGSPDATGAGIGCTLKLAIV